MIGSRRHSRRGLRHGVAAAPADSGPSEFVIAWRELLLYLVAAGVVGVIAAVWPARGAAGLNTLRAIATEGAHNRVEPKSSEATGATSDCAPVSGRAPTRCRQTGRV